LELGAEPRSGAIVFNDGRVRQQNNRPADGGIRRWQAVPEASSLAMISTGALSVIGLAARRRRWSAAAA
jgi:hypothetical protein